MSEFLKETKGLVKIEDILPLFPDFVQIDAFKEAICQSLEDYNHHIDDLKAEMADATRIADALRHAPSLLCALHARLPQAHLQGFLQTPCNCSAVCLLGCKGPFSRFKTQPEGST